MTRTHAVRLSAYALAFATVGAAALGAQAGPPLARAPRDSAPAIKRPVAPSAPPSSVAPRPGGARLSGSVVTDSGPKPMQRVSPPVDSMRPAPAPAPEAIVTPSRRVPTPPVRATSGAQAVSARAALVSDVPPAGATARCKDGTFVSITVDASTCSGNGGLAVRFPAPPASPKRPNP